MVWQYTPYTLPLVVTALLSASFAVLLAWRFKTRGAVISAVLMMAGSWWLLCVALNLAGGDIPTKTFWGRLKYIGIEVMPIGFLLLTLESLGYQRWLQQRRVLLMSVVPALLLALILTNDFHRLVWPTYTVTIRNSYLVSNNPKGIVYWINYVYIYVSLIFTMMLLLKAAFNSQHLYRRQALVLLIGPGAVWMVTFLEAFGILLGLPLSPMPIAWIGTVIVIFFTNYRLKIGVVIPIARQVVLDSIPEGVIVLDTAKRVLDINPAARRVFAGSAAEIVIGQPLSAFWATGAALFENETDATLPKELVTVQDEEQRIFDITVSNILDANRQVRSHIIVLRDVTSLRRTAQQTLELALERERINLLSGFIRDASHEFRTPLASIRLSVHLAGKTTDANRRDHHLRNIDTQIDNITGLLESLVLMARLDSGSALLMGLIDLNQLALEVSEGYQEQCAENNLRFSLDLSSGLPPIWANAETLTTALANLVKNAVQFTRPGGSIRLITCPGDREVYMQVEDTGVGISREHLSAIFTRFYRVDTSHTTPGFGLGLTIAQRIVERHGGRIEVESAPGVGSVFRIRLPLNHVP